MPSPDAGDLYLGVDGGGTKTAFILLDGGGRERARTSLACGYHPQVGLDGLGAVLDQGVVAVLGQAGAGAEAITHAFFGLPTYGEDSRITPALDALPRRVLGHDRYSCGNDMICGWAGALAGCDGVGLTAGTGSIAYGEHDGRIARSGGWGEVFGDEGSAYWIAIQGLALFSRMADGRCPPGPLRDIFRLAFSLTSDLDLSGLIIADYQGRRDQIAALSQLVAEADRAGDLQARGVMRAAAGELAGIVHAVARAIGYGPGDVVPMSVSGGVFQCGELILSPLREALRCCGAYELRSPLHDPAMGAGLYAMRCALGR